MGVVDLSNGARPSAAGGATIQAATGALAGLFAAMAATSIASRVVDRDLSWGLVVLWLPACVISSLAFALVYAFLFRGREVERAKPKLAAGYFIGWLAATAIWIADIRYPRLAGIDPLTYIALFFAGPLGYVLSALVVVKRAGNENG